MVTTAIPHFIGRVDELSDLLATVSSPPSLALVEGEAGIGKSRLVDELTARLTADGRRVVVGRCRRIREPFPLGPLVEVVRQLREVIAGRDLSPVCGVLRPLVPELDPVLPATPGTLDDRDARRHQMFRALAEVFTAAGPLTAVVEDAHWADEQTIEFAEYLLSDPPGDLSLILTYRGDEVDAAVLALTARLPHDVERVTVAVRPFDDAETGDLAAAILGTDRVSLEFAAHLRARAAGVPLVIQELMAVLRERRLVARYDGEWVRRTIDELELPAGVREPVRERVSRLDSQARAVLEAAAVLHEASQLEVVEAVTDLPRSERSRAVDQALVSGLLVEASDASIGFRHVLAAQVVYETLTPARRRELHRRAAASLRALRDPPLGQVAHHLECAGQLAEWAEAAEAAADQARHLGDNAEAARLVEAVLERVELDPEHRTRLALALAQDAVYSPRGAPMAELLVRLLDGSVGSPARGTQKLHLARLLDNVGADPARCVRLATEAIDELDDLPDRQAEAIALSASIRVPGRSRPEIRALLQRALDLIPSIRDPDVTTRVSAVVGRRLLWIGDPAWRQLRLPAASPEVTRPAFVAAYNLASEAYMSGHLDLADRLFQTMYDPDRALEYPRAVEISFRSVGLAIRHDRGAWAGLDAAFDGLLRDFETIATRHESEKALRATLALSRGEIDVAREHLSATVARAAELGNTYALTLAVAGLCRLANARGADGSVLGVDAYLATIEGGMVVPSLFRGLPPILAHLAAISDAGEAERALAVMSEAAAALDAPFAEPALLHAEGHVASRRQSWKLAAELLSRAAAVYDVAGMPYESAQAQEDAAIALVHTEDARAGAALRRALAVYDRLGARWDLSRGLGFAREHDLPVPAQHRGGTRGYGRDLSPREREVARLVAAGRTNREIAAELFLSTNTVNKHLSAILRKLEISSRHRVAGRLCEMKGAVAVEDG